MDDKSEDVDKLFMDFQERHDKHDDYVLLAKGIMKDNQ